MTIDRFIATMKSLSPEELALLSKELIAADENNRKPAIQDVEIEKGPEVISSKQTPSKIKMNYTHSVDLFNVLYSRLAESERGYSNNPSDPGGPTIWGISTKAFPHLASRIKNRTLTKAEAKQITKETFFDVLPMIHDIDPGLAYLAFDAKFHGNYEAIEQLQIGFNTKFSSKYGFKIDSDGVYGFQTAKAFSLISSDEATELIHYFGGKKALVAREAADRILSYQKRNGLPIQDMYAGMLKRNDDRYTNAIQIKEQIV